MGTISSTALVGLAVLVGSALPFVPTGETVSGASALVADSWSKVALIFAVAWVGSVVGDVVMLLEARWASRWLRGWLARRSFAKRVDQAQQALSKNAFTAVVTGRLIPGTRTAVILALGLSRHSIKRFLLYDTVACALWALIYAALGSVGGQLSGHPVVALAIAIVLASGIGLLVTRVSRWRAARSGAESTPTSAAVPAEPVPARAISARAIDTQPAAPAGAMPLVGSR